MPFLEAVACALECSEIIQNSKSDWGMCGWHYFYKGRWKHRREMMNIQKCAWTDWSGRNAGVKAGAAAHQQAKAQAAAGKEQADQDG